MAGWYSAVPLFCPLQDGVVTTVAPWKLSERNSLTVSWSGGQPMLPVVVRTRSTWPAATCAGPGMYETFRPEPVN